MRFLGIPVRIVSSVDVWSDRFVIYAAKKPFIIKPPARHARIQNVGLLEQYLFDFSCCKVEKGDRGCEQPLLRKT